METKWEGRNRTQRRTYCVCRPNRRSV